jgi:hypothetical protein
MYDSDPIGHDFADSVDVSPDGLKVYGSGVLNESDFGAVAFSATSGSLLSVAQYDGGQDDDPEESILSGDGFRLYTTGAIPGSDSVWTMWGRSPTRRDIAAAGLGRGGRPASQWELWPGLVVTTVDLYNPALERLIRHSSVRVSQQGHLLQWQAGEIPSQ